MSKDDQPSACKGCQYWPNCKYIPSLTYIENVIREKINPELNQSFKENNFPFSSYQQIFCSARKKEGSEEAWH